MIRLAGFQGELPRLHPRMLPDTSAQIAEEVKLDAGVLTPYRRPADVDTIADTNGTLYKDGSTWLSWPSVVDVLPGAVRQDRLYIFGDGEPKMRVAGQVYNLRIAPPTTRLNAALRVNSERLVFGNREVIIRDGAQATTSTGWEISCQATGGKATITLSHPTGATPAATQTLLNGITYRCQQTGADCIPHLVIVRILSIRDTGGQTLSAGGKKLGSDTRSLANVGSVIRVNGTPLTATIPSAATIDSDDVAGQNDPPILTITGLNPIYDGLGGYVNLFSGATINTIEAGQNIDEIVIEFDGLARGVVSPAQAEDYVYTYTYVTEFDEETEPAPLSNIVSWAYGQSTRLSGFLMPPSGRGFDRMRIYRSQTDGSGRTDLYLIAERSLSTASFDDTIELLPSQEPIPSLNYTRPDAGIEGAVAMPNGMMAAWKGRDLYFCEPFRHHAWPAIYSQRVDSPIVGLAAFGSSLAILTEKKPYLAQGTHPENMRVEKVEADVPCVARRSIVDMGYFAAYASTTGLATISTSGAKIVSRDMLTPDDWDNMRPRSMIASQHEGRYVVSHADRLDDNRRRTTIFDLTFGTPFLTRSRIGTLSWFYDEAYGALYYVALNSRQVRRFDPPTGRAGQLQWRSKRFYFAEPQAFSCVQIDSDSRAKDRSVSLTVYADGRPIGVVTRVNEVVRLRSGRMAREWMFDVKGDMQIIRVRIAYSPEELAQDIG